MEGGYVSFVLRSGSRICSLFAGSEGSRRGHTGDGSHGLITVATEQAVNKDVPVASWMHLELIL